MSSMGNDGDCIVWDPPEPWVRRCRGLPLGVHGFDPVVRWASYAELHGRSSWDRNGEHWDLCGDGGEPGRDGKASRCISALPLGSSIDVREVPGSHWRHKPLWYHVKGLNQTASGYGSKLVTPWEVECTDGRWRRVYCMIWSNSGTCYIIHNGHRVIV